jgi:hypothetical protein
MTPARDVLAEAFAAEIADDPPRIALLAIAAATTDPGARRIAIDALANSVGAELGDAIALEVVQRAEELTSR